MLDEPAIERFVGDGYILIRHAVPAEIVRACRDEVETALRGESVDVDDPGTWTVPVVRVACPETPAFAAAGTQPILWEAYDQLLGPGTWWRRRGVGGTIPVRFPHDADPGDAGWHIDGSFEVGGTYWVNLASRDRGLLALFLFSDVGVDDAPTELKVGSHLDVPRLLEPFGHAGVSFDTISHRLSSTTFERPSAAATGRAGDVYVCHPFLVHRATWPHRGQHPRAIAQPGVATLRPFTLVGDHPCPVERAILAGLDRP